MLSPDLRLVVANLDLTQSLSAQSPKVSWGVDWGTTKVSLSVPARVHYAIDLSGAQPVRFEPDAKNGTLTAIFSEPEVQAVEIFSENRQTVIEPGWGRFAAFSGAGLVDALDRGLYASLWRQAGTPAQLEQVKTLAGPALGKLVSDYLARTGDRQAPRVIVTFR